MRNLKTGPDAANLIHFSLVAHLFIQHLHNTECVLYRSVLALFFIDIRQVIQTLFEVDNAPFVLVHLEVVLHHVLKYSLLDGRPATVFLHVGDPEEAAEGVRLELLLAHADASDEHLLAVLAEVRSLELQVQDRILKDG